MCMEKKNYDIIWAINITDYVMNINYHELQTNVRLCLLDVQIVF